jgi:hypothetical protein
LRLGTPGLVKRFAHVTFVVHDRLYRIEE